MYLIKLEIMDNRPKIMEFVCDLRTKLTTCLDIFSFEGRICTFYVEQST